jgi:hypothetical protein
VTTTVRATGLASLSGQDVAAAFEQAKQAALRQAAEQGMGVLVSASTQVRNFAVIDDQILSQTKGFVSRYEVVEQGPADGQTYRVTVEAQVDLGSLYAKLDALDLLVDAVGNPRILCLSRERLEEVDGPSRRLSESSVAAAALEDALRAASDRFALVAPAAADGSSDPEALLAGSGPEIVAWCRRQGADLAVLSETLVRPVATAKIPFSDSRVEDLGLHSATAEVKVRALWTDTGEVVAVLSRVQRAADRSLETAAVKAVRQGIAGLSTALVDRLVEDWRQKAYAGRLIHLVVHGEPVQLRDFEREFPGRAGGIDKLFPRQYGAGRAEYDAHAQGAAFQVARRLSAGGLSGLDVEVLAVSLNTLELRLMPRAAVGARP